MFTRADCAARDAADALAPLRAQFELPEGAIYLDGNSLGAKPRSVAGRLRAVIDEEWGHGLIRSWNSAGWIDAPRRVGDLIAPLIGAGANEVVAADSTSVNLYKVLSAALSLQRARAPDKRVIVSERSNFPTDLYIAQSLARQFDCALRLVSAEQLLDALDESVSVLLLTQVNYRSGALHDMATLTAAVHRVGALAIWDLAHSAGALPVDVRGADADFAIGCGYKYLNGGPGAPAFVWAHPRYADSFEQPLSGWLGHATPFAFSDSYRPAAGIGRYLCGTPAILALAALEEGVKTLHAAGPFGGMAALRRKSVALTSLFIDAVEARCGGFGLTLRSPREAERRGSQVSFSHDESGYAVMQALIERGVIGDFRAGLTGALHAVQERAPDDADSRDLLRFGFTPLYTRYVDVWDAVEHLRDVLASEQWREPRFSHRATVT